MDGISGYLPALPVQGIAEQARPAIPETAGINTSSAAWKAAKQFESLLLSQAFEAMFAGLKTDGMFGGGQSETIYRSFMLQSYADGMAQQGSFGIAESVYRDIAAYYNGTGGDDHG